MVDGRWWMEWMEWMDWMGDGGSLIVYSELSNRISEKWNDGILGN
jgi:hypothetical protein